MHAEQVGALGSERVAHGKCVKPAETDNCAAAPIVVAFAPWRIPGSAVRVPAVSGATPGIAAPRRSSRAGTTGFTCPTLRPACL